MDLYIIAIYAALTVANVAVCIATRKDIKEYDRQIKMIELLHMIGIKLKEEMEIVLAETEKKVAELKELEAKEKDK